MKGETQHQMPIYPMTPLTAHSTSDLPRYYPEIFKRALAKKGLRRER